MNLRGIVLAVCLYGLAVFAMLSTPQIAADRAELKQIVSEHYDQDFLSRSSNYSRARLILFFTQVTLVLTIFGLLVTGGLDRWRRKTFSLVGESAWLGRLLLLSTLYLGFASIRLTFAIIRFLHAQHYGLRHDTLTAFVIDWTKGFAITGSMAMLVGLLVLVLFAAMPRWWWVVSGSIVAALTIAYITVAPVIIDPLFYRFSKLENNVLEQRLLNLSRKGGISAAEILVADASRRSPTVNAYFTGFENTRRIVLYDNLINKFDADEVAIVVAHEIGHWREKHIQKGLVIGLTGLFLCLMIAHLILRWFVDNRIGSLSGRGDPALVIPAYGLYTLMTYVAIVPGNWISRQMESQADRVCLELTQDADTFIRTKTRIAKENLSNVLPPSWVESTLFTHPSIARRILMAKKYKCATGRYSADSICDPPMPR